MYIQYDVVHKYMYKGLIEVCVSVCPLWEINGSHLTLSHKLVLISYFKEWGFGGQYVYMFFIHSVLAPLTGVAKLLLQYGANINTHSNEFKESALTLACYKGHLEMVKFLLSAGEL